MAEDYLALTEGKVRSCRLAYLIINGGTLVLKHRFDTETSTRKNFLQEEKPKLLRLGSGDFLTRAQLRLLYPSTGSSSSDNYDITLLVALHRTCLCTKKENDPIWSFGNPPKDNDHSVEADIVRLRDFRNELSHQSMPEITEAEYNTKWQHVCQVLLRLGNGIPDLKDTLEKLRLECFDKETEQQLLRTLEDLFKQDKAFGDGMMKTVQSYSPCANILEQSKEELSNVLDDTFFVATNPFKEAKKILNVKWIVLLIGPMGTGKSTNGIKLVEDINRCLKVNKISDLDSLNTSLVDIIFIDDIFGDSKFDKDDGRKWQKILQKIENYVQNKRLKIILTSRTNIWKEALQSMNVSNLIDDSNTFTMTSMTDEDKTCILEKHLQMNNRTLSHEKVVKCIEAANKRSSFIVGFPECATLFCQRNDLFRQEHAFFESPIIHIKHCLSEIFKNNEKVFLAFFVLWAQKPQKLHLVKLEESLDSIPKTILDPIKQMQFRPEEEVRTLRGSLESHSRDFINFDPRKEIFTFSHYVISDVFGLVAYEKNGTAVLKYCHASFIKRYFRTDENPNGIGFQGEDIYIGHEIVLPRSRFDTLCATIGDKLVEINGGLIKEECDCTTEVVDLTRPKDVNEVQVEYMKCFPLLYPVFRNRTFCEIFLKYIMKDKIVQILTKPVSTVEGEFKGFEKILDEGICKADICLFAYLVKRSMIEFKDFLSVCFNEMSTLGFENENGENVLKSSLLISLLLAIRQNNLEMVEFLATLGAPVDDQSVILTALKMADRDVVTFLLQKSSTSREISSYFTRTSQSPLLMFVEDDNVEAVKCILSLMDCTKDDIDVQNEADINHDTVLHKACTKGQYEVVEKMLLRNPNVLSRNVNGFCPIHEAAMAGKTNVVKLLLQHNRKQAEYVVNLSENMQRIKLYHIAVYRQNSDLIDVLEELKIPIDCVDEVKHQTPLLFALHEMKTSVMRKLTELSIKHGVHNNSDCTGNNALHVAMEKLQELTDTPDYDIYLEIISLLLYRSDTDINLQSKEGQLALQLAEENEISSGESDETQSAHTIKEDENPAPAKKMKQSS